MFLSPKGHITKWLAKWAKEASFGSHVQFRRNMASSPATTPMSKALKIEINAVNVQNVSITNHSFIGKSQMLNQPPIQSLYEDFATSWKWMWRPVNADLILSIKWAFAGRSLKFYTFSIPSKPRCRHNCSKKEANSTNAHSTLCFTYVNLGLR